MADETYTYAVNCGVCDVKLRTDVTSEPLAEPPVGYCGHHAPDGE